MIPLKMTLLQKNPRKPTGLKQKIPAEENCPDSVHDFTEFTTQPIKDHHERRLWIWQKKVWG